MSKLFPGLPSIDTRLEGEHLYLRRLSPGDVSSSYVTWLNDMRINRFLECRHVHHTYESVVDYVKSLLADSSNELLMGIFAKDDDAHIGNIKLGPICAHNKHADIGLMIGDLSRHSRGYGSSAIKLLSEFAFDNLQLISLRAGCYEQNIGSYRAFLKAGWHQSGLLKNYWVDTNGRKQNEILLSLIRKPRLSLIRQGGITLIGSGDLLLMSAAYLRNRGIPVLCVIAPRHADKAFMDHLESEQCSVVVTDDINNDDSILASLDNYSRLCLCFGPAWIFNESVLNVYSGRIFNFNGIPLPIYLGGAHFTWQILNQSTDAGAYIQQITEAIDRGPFVKALSFNIKGVKLTPRDYEIQYLECCTNFLQEFLDAILTERELTLNDELINWNESLYFPRLNTALHAWIDWSWTAEQVAQFCQAFDNPYPGARSSLDGKTVILKDVSFEHNAQIHPYCAGLIVRQIDSNRFLIACNKGFIRASIMYSDTQGTIKVGRRITTPAANLEQSKQSVGYNSLGLSL